MKLRWLKTTVLLIGVVLLIAVPIRLMFGLYTVPWHDLVALGAGVSVGVLHDKWKETRFIPGFPKPRRVKAPTWDQDFKSVPPPVERTAIPYDHTGFGPLPGEGPGEPE